MSAEHPRNGVVILPQGALIHYFRVAGHNIVCSLPSDDLYTKKADPYFGRTIGRVSNRIKDATIHLNGKDYPLATNNGPNCLHGGKEGWGEKVWTGPVKETRHGKEGELWKYLSKDGDDGFPGTVEARVWYAQQVDEGSDKVVLDMEYEAELVGGECEETAVAMANHSYFNVSSGQTIDGTTCNLATVKHLPTDSVQIPTGEITPFPGLEANKNFTMTAQDPKVDHCLIMDTEASKVPLDTRSRGLQRLVTLHHENSGIKLVIESTEPAFQFYTGDGTNVPSYAGQPPLGARSGIAIEPSRYVNAASVPEWRGMVTLRKGQVWGSHSRYTAWKE